MLARWFEHQWQQRGWALCLLWPLSLLFILLAAMRRALYRSGRLASRRLPVPVIVVGNISVGGVGKTPLVLWLAQALREAGYQPGILSRGYGSEQSGEVSADSNPQQLGDEPVLLAQRSGCPVWVHPQRVQGGMDLLHAYPSCDVLICDDGLQHYALQRDIEIAVVQRPYGLGNGLRLPAGPLRESCTRLDHVDVIVETGVVPAQLPQQPCYQLQLRAAEWTAVADATQHIQTAALAEQTLVAVAGIGHPQRFFNRLHALGLRFSTRIFADHHAYTLADFTDLAGKTVLMTEKDAVKCRSLGLSNAWYLPVTAELNALNSDQSLRDTVIHLLQTRKGI